MKKIKSAVLILAFGATLLAACAGKADEKEVQKQEASQDVNEFLVREGVKLTCEMDELASSDVYMEMMTASPGIADIAAKMAEGDYAMPDTVLVIHMPEDILGKTLGIGEDRFDVSEPVKAKLKNKINGSVFANMINAGYGSDLLAAGAVMNWGESYPEPAGWRGNEVLLIQYGGEFSSIVSFSESGSQVISGSAIFVKNGDQDLLNGYQEYLGDPELECEEIAGSRLEEILK